MHRRLNLGHGIVGAGQVGLVDRHDVGDLEDAGLFPLQVVAGLGLDEDTAAFMSPDDTIEVEGTGGVTIVDGSEVSFCSIDRAEEGQPVSMLGLKVHVLIAGATFNLQTRTATAGALVMSKE